MKKFEIIEEGRLSKLEMNKVLGGDTASSSYTCVPKNQYKVTPNCIGNDSYGTCPKYSSCSGKSFTSCSGYKGVPGPAGCGGTIPSTGDSFGGPITVDYHSVGIAGTYAGDYSSLI
jgi:hypothetical protein